MACQAMHSWTFGGLVGAFLDLAIAYLLLCASTLAFMASKFLGFLGLCLPCPCNGLFGNPKGSYCLQRLLVDFPIETVSSVQLSVKSKLPFSSIWEKDQNYHLNLKVIRDRDSYVEGLIEMEGDASCSSISGTGKSENVSERDLVLRNESDMGLGVVNSSLHVKEGRFDLKGKGIINQRPRSGLRRSRKRVTDFGKVSSVSSENPSCADAQSPFSIIHKGGEEIELSSVPFDSGVDANRFHYDEEDHVMGNIVERASHGFDLIEPFDEDKLAEKNASFEEIKSNAQRELDFDGNEKNAIRILEQALEEEQAARAALYLELEKERSAAASAADEAMAMILRLQEEKASIGMEARQYQRIIEEKSAYDAEEMNILKEILVRRETEKHFLEKEVEAYIQMIYDGNQQLQDDIQSMENKQREQLSSPLDLGEEDTFLMLQQLSKSIDKKEIVKEKSSVNKASSINEKHCALAVGEKLQISGWDGPPDFSKPVDLDKQFSETLTSSEEHNFSEKTILLSGEQEEQDINAHECKGMAIKTVETHNVPDIDVPYDGEILEQHGKKASQGSKDPGNLILDREPCIHDVHVIDGESNLFNEIRENKNELLLENDISNVHRINDMPLKGSEVQRIDVKTDCSSTSGMNTEPDIDRSSSDMTPGLPPLCGKSIPSNLQRNSTPVVENERLKIDSEVEWLRERLRIVQEGREKLNFPVEHQERENFQLQLLEDIACQLREIRQLTEPGKAVRQASLPLLSPKSSVKEKAPSKCIFRSSQKLIRHLLGILSIRSLMISIHKACDWSDHFLEMVELQHQVDRRGI
ncbi:unnamed protein product [Camellia sinensis]